MKYLVMASVFLLSAALSPTVVMAEEEEKEKELPKVLGEVRKVKEKSGKITIRHEPIPNLDMPGMSMVFRIDEGVDISQFSKGETVEFTVVERDGKMVIITIEKSEEGQ